MSHTLGAEASLFTMDHLHTFDAGQSNGVDTEYLLASEGSPSVPGANVFHRAATLADDGLGSTELDWVIPKSALPPGPFTMYGSTVDTNVGLTYTVTGPLTVAPVPEPSTVALLLTGLLAGAAFWRRRGG